MIQVLKSRRAAGQTAKAPDLPGIPEANLVEVDRLYGTTIEKLVLGLVDALEKTKSKEIWGAAVKAGLIEG